MSPRTYLFFGNVGAGKGTQVELLKKILGEGGSRVVYISPGVEFRKFILEKGYSNLLAKNILDRGNLLPVFLVADMFANVVTRELQSPEDHLIMDGFPRSLEQVPIFESAMRFYERKNIEIVYVRISKQESIKRLKLRARHDDTDEGIAHRFEEYERNVIPSLENLRGKGYKIHEINGEQTIDAVHEDIKNALGL